MTGELFRAIIRAVAIELASGSRLLTIGYQRRTLRDLIRRLRNRDVRLLVDVRERARSRRPEFNGAQLEEALARSGIAYVHVPRLGSPTSLRRTLYQDGDFERFAGLYLAYVRRWRLGAVSELVALVTREGTACILCYESNHDACHRGIVAREALRLAPPGQLSVEHL